VADNTLQQGNDPIATDELTVYNGTTVAAGTVYAPRTKVGYGDDSTYRDASDNFPLPIRHFSDAAALTSVTASTTSVTVIGANTIRRGLSVHAVTSGTGTCYVRVGGGTATAALGGHSFDMAPGAYWEAPYGFTGAVTAIWSASSGGLNVTEYT
jgi:hypothetical protein